MMLPFDVAEPDVRIIDLSAGRAAVWFGDRPRNVVAIDHRPGFSANVVGDTRSLPFAADCFDLGLFDPPHTNFGANGQMAERYGHSTVDEILSLIRGTSIEAGRCIRGGGLMALKWSDRDIGLTRVLGLMPEWLPLFGHHVAQRPRRTNKAGDSTTWWLLLANRK